MQARASTHMRNTRHETPLDIAARLGRTAHTRILVNHSPSVVLSSASDALPDCSIDAVESAKEGVIAACYPVHAAAKNGHVETLELLLSAGFDVDFVTETGSALHCAALHGRLDCVRALLANGADREVTNMGAMQLCLDNLDN